MENINANILMVFYDTYNRWPKDCELRNIIYFLKNYNSNMPELYKPLFKKLIYLTKVLKIKEINKRAFLLVEFHKKFNRFPTENEMYKNVNLYDFSYALKFLELYIDINYKNYLNNNNFFYGNKNHKNIVFLIKYLYLYKDWPKKDTVFEKIKMSRLIENIRKEKTNIYDEDKKILNLLDFFNSTEKNHNKVLLLIEFYKKTQRFPHVKEKYKNVYPYQILYSIRKGIFHVSSKDRKALQDLGLLHDTTHSKYLMLLEFYEKFNRWPKYKEVYNDISLGYFSSYIKTNKDVISNQEKETLQEKGFIFKY